MKKLSVVFIGGLMSLALALNLLGQEKKEMKEVTLKGEIIDVKCYASGMMGGRGPDHEECAISCIKGGLPVGILDEKSGKAYVLVPKKGMKSANEELLPHVAKIVVVKGSILQKDGANLFAYSSVEEGK
jgi:hypothetical protein